MASSRDVQAIRLQYEIYCASILFEPNIETELYFGEGRAPTEGDIINQKETFGSATVAGWRILRRAQLFVGR